MTGWGNGHVRLEPRDWTRTRPPSGRVGGVVDAVKHEIWVCRSGEASLDETESARSEPIRLRFTASLREHWLTAASKHLASGEDAISVQVSWPSSQSLSPSLVIFCIFPPLFYSCRVEFIIPDTPLDYVGGMADHRRVPESALNRLAACLFLRCTHVFLSPSPRTSPPTQRKARSL